MLALCIFIFNSGFIAVSHAQWGHCYSNDQSVQSEQMFVDASSYLCVQVPAVLLFLFIFLITWELRKHQRTRWQTIIGGNYDQNAPDTQSKNLAERQLQQASKAERSITFMLLLSATFFVLMSLPLFVFMLDGLPTSYFNAIPQTKLLPQIRYFTFWMVAKGLETFSHAINFFIYFMSARKFRVNLLLCCRSVVCRDGGRATKNIDTFGYSMNTSHTVNTEMTSRH